MQNVEYKKTIDILERDLERRRVAPEVRRTLGMVEASEDSYDPALGRVFHPNGSLVARASVDFTVT